MTYCFFCYVHDTATTEIYTSLHTLSLPDARPSALAEVHETLVARIGDEEAEKKVLTGALVKAISYSGFGSVDIEGAVAIDDDEPALTVIEGEGDRQSTRLNSSH